MINTLNYTLKIKNQNNFITRYINKSLKIMRLAQNEFKIMLQLTLAFPQEFGINILYKLKTIIIETLE